MPLTAVAGEETHIQLYFCPYVTVLTRLYQDNYFEQQCSFSNPLCNELCRLGPRWAPRSEGKSCPAYTAGAWKESWRGGPGVGGAAAV